MSALQKKRDEFRNQIRRTQLEKYREEKRKALFHQQINFELLQKIDHTFTDLEEFLSQVALKSDVQNSMDMTSASIFDESTSIKQVIACFQQLKSLAPFEYEQVFTKYMIEKKSAERVMRIFVDLVRNEVQNEDESDGEVQEKYNPILRSHALLEILKFLDILSYIVIGYESMFILIEGIWNILTDEIFFSKLQDFGFIKITLSILSKILEDSKNQIIYRYMVQKGIRSQIVSFIDRIRKINVSLEIHEKLLNLINNYLASELSFPPQISDKIGQVTINSSSVHQKEIIFIYCVVFISKKEESLFLVTFSALAKLVEIHEFLISQLEEKYLIQISELIKNPNREIQVESLNLLNDFTYCSQNCLDFLLQKGNLLDLLHDRLIIEASSNDSNVTSCVQKIAYIICNSTLTEKPGLKKIVLSHHIWQDVFNSFHPSNKLFPLIVTMMYFLEANGHKNFKNFLVPFLEALRNFEWEQCKYSNEIRKTIENTFQNANYKWQDYEQKLFLSILYQYGFLGMVEDFCEPELIQEIKGEQI